MSDSPPTPDPILRPTQSNRRFVIILACMVIAFVAVVVFRNRIRCEWWAYRLAAATAPADHAYYVSCLMACDEDALPAIRRLTRDEKPEIRAISLLLIGRRQIETIVDIIPPVLHDPDRDIRESAGTTLAFSAAQAAIDLLCDTAATPNDDIACSALASLGRTSNPSAIATLCDALTRRPQPLVRAQAAESLAEAIAPALDSSRAALAPSKNCDPVAALVRALADQARFSGMLTTERQISRVTAHVASQTTRPVSPPTEQPPTRTVAAIAAAGLSRLTGEQVDAHPVIDEEAASARFRELILSRNR